MRAADGCEADAGTGAVESPGADVASRAAAEDGADGTAAQRGTKGRALRFIASSGTLHRLAGGVCDLVFLRSSYFMCEGSNSQMLLPPPPHWSWFRSSVAVNSSTQYICTAECTILVQHA